MAPDEAACAAYKGALRSWSPAQVGAIPAASMVLYFWGIRLSRKQRKNIANRRTRWPPAVCFLYAAFPAAHEYWAYTSE